MYKVLSENELKKEAQLSKRLEKKGLRFPEVKKSIAKKMERSADRDQNRKHAAYVSHREKMGSIKKENETYHGRPIEELKREAGIGKYKGRYN
jgi:hypothetical protein